METILTSHLVPLQPPYPLIYIGKPYNRVCKHLATILVPSEPGGGRVFDWIPVVETEDYPAGISYEQFLLKGGMFYSLNIKQGDQNIPWEKIMTIAKYCDLLNLKEIDPLGNLSRMLKANGCTVCPPETITIMAWVIFDENKFLYYKLGCSEMNIHATVPVLGDPGLDDFFDFIGSSKNIWGDFNLKMKIYISTVDLEITEEMRRYAKELYVYYGTYFELNRDLDSYLDEDIKQALIEMKYDSKYCRNGKATKKQILKYFNEKLEITPYEYTQLWKMLIDNKWLWYDEYSGIYKIVAE